MTGHPRLRLDEQRDLQRKIADLLVVRAPADRDQIRVLFRACGGHQELVGHIMGIDGQLREWDAPPEAAEFFLRLRAGMYAEGAGTWSSASMIVEYPIRTTVNFTFKEDPLWHQLPPRTAVLDDLEAFPRNPDTVPAWMKTVLPHAERVAEVAWRFRHARLFDHRDAAGKPVVNRPPVAEADRAAILAYLNGAHVVMGGRGFDPDLFDPTSAADVPAAFHTDGTWIWPASLPHYLAKHGIPPEPDLVTHLRANGFTPPVLDQQTKDAAYTALTGEVPHHQAQDTPARPGTQSPPGTHVETTAQAQRRPDPDNTHETGAQAQSGTRQPTGTPDPAGQNQPGTPPSPHTHQAAHTQADGALPGAHQAGGSAASPGSTNPPDQQAQAPTGTHAPGGQDQLGAPLSPRTHEPTGAHALPGAHQADSAATSPDSTNPPDHHAQARSGAHQPTGAPDPGGHDQSGAHHAAATPDHSAQAEPATHQASGFPGAPGTNPPAQGTYPATPPSGAHQPDLTAPAEPTSPRAGAHSAAIPFQAGPPQPAAQQPAAQQPGTQQPGTQQPPELTARERRVLDIIERQISEAGALPAAYRLLAAEEGALCLERVGTQWQVASYERGKPRDPQLFGQLWNAGAYLLGSLTLLPSSLRAGRGDRNTAQALNDWPVQPLPGEPPLTLLADKHLAVLMPGREIVRHGPTAGNLTFAAGTEFTAMSLRAERAQQGPHRYRVSRELRTLSGHTVAWHGQPGGGTAYLLPRSVEEHLADGSLTEV